MSVQDEIWQFFANKGLPSHAIAAIMASVDGESSFRPHVWGDDGTAYGLFQHRGPRQEALFAKYGNKPSVQDQLNFVWDDEFGGTEKKALKSLLASKDVGTATWNFIKSFERPEHPERDYARRLPVANKWLETYGGSSPEWNKQATQQIPITTGTQAGRSGPADVSRVKKAILEKYQNIQNKYGQALPIVSGYRDKSRNAMAGGAKHSQHILGNAIDIDVSKLPIEERQKLIQLARQEGVGGIGVYDNSLHFDTGKYRAWGPTYKKESIPEWAQKFVWGKAGAPVEQGPRIPIPYPKPPVPGSLPPLPERLTGPDVLGGMPNVPPTSRRMTGPDVLGGMPPPPAIPVQPGPSSPTLQLRPPTSANPFYQPNAPVGSPPKAPFNTSGPQPGLSSPPVPSVKPAMNLQGMFAGLLGALGGLGGDGEAGAQAEQANMQAAEEAARRRAEWAMQNGWGTGLSELI